MYFLSSAPRLAMLPHKTMLKLAQQVLTRPRWALQWAKAGGPPDLTVPNMAAPGEAPQTFFGVYGEWMGTKLPGWDDLAWLRPVGRAVDAQGRHARRRRPPRCGRQLRRDLGLQPRREQPRRHAASIRALPAVAEAVGDRMEVVLDSGIRRGSDVVKALALGARAVMLGRAYLWGLAANGQAGVENVLDILRSGIDSALLGMGKTSVRDLSREDILVPEDFERRLGDFAVRE